jgi:hypothetical protein
MYSNGPKIVTDGLALCLDAGNAKSYPGTGTIWTDISRNNRDATLINGPTFSSDNYGGIIFDGTNDYATVTLSSEANYSLSFWLYVTSLPASGEEQVFDPAGIGAGSVSLLFSSGAWKWHSWNGTASRIGNTVFTGRWYNFVMTTAVTATNFFINGVLDSQFVNGTSLVGGQGALFSVKGGGTRNLNGVLSSFLMYNKALSASEILQNYNATKGRFKL